jgi:hypothetical protein
LSNHHWRCLIVILSLSPAFKKRYSLWQQYFIFSPVYWNRSILTRFHSLWNNMENMNVVYHPWFYWYSACLIGLALLDHLAIWSWRYWSW